jgi:dihydroorotate dehydrogenase electron transfer subunit
MLIKKEELREGLFDFTIQNKEMAEKCLAGQFLHIKCGNKTMLRRPISICDVEGDNIRFIFEVRGEGTKELSQFKVGESLDVLGPLGKGFTLLDKSKKVIFIGGGIGIFPLLMAAKHYGENAIVLLGFRDKKTVVLKNEFEKLGCTVLIATDDGSEGYNGFVTDLLNPQNIDGIFACGPKPMLIKTAKFAKENGIFCELSMEERMGCGIGACLVCACKTKKGEGTTFSHVCKDGPVFNASEVIFDD